MMLRQRSVNEIAKTVIVLKNSGLLMRRIRRWQLGLRSSSLCKISTRLWDKLSLANRFLPQSSLGSIFLSASIAVAGSESYDYKAEAPPPPQPWCETPPTLEIRIGVPGWFTGVAGNSGVKGVVASPDVSFDQLLKHLTHVPIVLSADIRYQRSKFLRRL